MAKNESAGDVPSKLKKILTHAGEMVPKINAPVSLLGSTVAIIISVYGCLHNSAVETEKSRAAAVLTWTSEVPEDGSTLKLVQAGTNFAIENVEIRFPAAVLSTPLVLGPGENSFSAHLVETGLGNVYAPCAKPFSTTVVDGTMPIEIQTEYLVAGKYHKSLEIYRFQFMAGLTQSGLQYLRLIGLAREEAPITDSTEDFVANWKGLFTAAGKCSPIPRTPS